MEEPRIPKTEEGEAEPGSTAVFFAV